MRFTVHKACWVITLVCCGCGEDAPAPSNAAGSGNSGSGGTVQAGSGGAGGAAGSAGSGGTPAVGGSGAAAGSGAGAALDCSGDWAAPELVLQVPGRQVSSPALPGDELELFYAITAEDRASEVIEVARRASKTDAFQRGALVPELLPAACPPDLMSVDVSDDGLRAYVGCGASIEEPHTVYLAERPSRSANFALRETPIAVGAGLSFAVSRDELTGYSSGVPYGSPPLVFQRSSVTAVFGAPMPVAGLETTQLNAPDLANDELTIWGSQAGSNESKLVFAERPDPSADFAAPTVLELGEGYYGGIMLSADCRTAYFAKVLPPQSSLQRMRR